MERALSLVGLVLLTVGWLQILGFALGPHEGTVQDMILYISLVVAIIGCVIYLVIDHPKYSTVGLTMLQTGLLAFLLSVVGAGTLHLR